MTKPAGGMGGGGGGGMREEPSTEPDSSQIDLEELMLKRPIVTGHRRQRSKGGSSTSGTLSMTETSQE